MPKNKRAKLVSGKCDFCQNDAEIPWEGEVYCYDCWHLMWTALREIEYEEKKAKRAEARPLGT